MRILFQSQDLWELVDSGYSTAEDVARVWENKKRDSKALFFIASAVHESIFHLVWTLKQDFETLQMKNTEDVQAYTVVSKILRSLTPKFTHIVAAIEEAKDLSILSLDELSGSLQAHEVRLNKLSEYVESKAFQVEGETSNVKRDDKSSSRGREKNNYRGRGRGRGRGRSTDRQRQQQRNYGYPDGEWQGEASAHCPICPQIGS
ncbi:hypothetical protein IHE45_01G027000 [Dioscorea alata]|uniref:Uncharacterized protein n=1 Tax=Dioscorea alata TaxID=55571 RepID=A0ACB7WTJ2_DIOAL|nr:hypothetical protein IHE45_01G027000 [Dioscorea alata]